MKKLLEIIEENKLEMLEFSVTESKISIDFKNEVSENILKKIHQNIKNI